MFVSNRICCCCLRQGEAKKGTLPLLVPVGIVLLPKLFTCSLEFWAKDLSNKCVFSVLVRCSQDCTIHAWVLLQDCHPYIHVPAPPRFFGRAFLEWHAHPALAKGLRLDFVSFSWYCWCFNALILLSFLMSKNLGSGIQKIVQVHHSLNRSCSCLLRRLWWCMEVESLTFVFSLIGE